MNITKDPRYKTALCKNFQNGECRYGDRCSFAHGQGELRGRPSLWKMNVRDPDGNGSYEIEIKKYIRASSKKEAIQKIFNLDDPFLIILLIRDTRWGALDDAVRIAKKDKLHKAIFEDNEDLSVKEARVKVNAHKEEVIEFLTKFDKCLTEYDLID